MSLFTLCRRLSVLLAAFLLWTPLASAQPVSEPMPNGRVAPADYRPGDGPGDGPGDAGRPAVLLLHGFLQTHHFSIIQTLADELADVGFPVLAPTLTLGIDQRRESLPCDAIQNHRLDDGAAELERWVAWLVERGHSRVVLMGHSSGSLRVLLYAAERGHPALAGVVLLSMGYFGDWEHPEAAPAELARARAARRAGETALARYHLSFCKGNYLAPPAAYLSYAEVEGERLSAALARLDRPTTLIFGSADQQLPPGWIGRVAAYGHRQRLIAGAGHFFSGSAEFELQSEVVEALEGIEAETGAEGGAP